MDLELLVNLLHNLDQMLHQILVFQVFSFIHTSLTKSRLFCCLEVRTSEGMQLDALVGNSLEELGITKHSGPRYSTYATLEARLKSFNHWPFHLKQSPRAMAQAGFFHLGKSSLSIKKKIVCRV